MPLNITDTDVYTALVAFINLIVPAGTEVRQGQQNRVPQPSGDFVQLTSLGAPRRIGTNLDTTEAVVSNGVITGFTAAVQADYEYRVQADFVSANAESWSMAAELLWRDSIAFDSMPSNIKPLYSEGRQQLPIIGGEDQWIQRWTMTLVLDYQPIWTQPTEAATGLTIIPEPIEVYYPPSWSADTPNVNAGSGSSTADGNV